MKKYENDMAAAGRARWTRGAFALVSVGALLVATGCSDDADSGGSGGSGMGGDGNDGSEMLGLSIELTNLEPLAGGFEYEGWFIHKDGPVSAGRFNLEEGESTAEVEIPHAAADGATTYVLTIEPPLADDDPEPSKTHVLAGSWNDSSASLTVDHAAALGNDFMDAAGQFFLQTPTSSAADDYSLGIWFITPGDTMSAGLVLPELPEGWAYEGWVASEDGPVSTGRFVDAAGADDDGAGPDAGDGEAPPFPGQDFIEPPLDLLEGDFVAVISVEPMPDDSPAPFAFKPLVGEITDEGAGGVQMMDNMSDNVPSGTVMKVE